MKGRIIMWTNLATNYAAIFIALGTVMVIFALQSDTSGWRELMAMIIGVVVTLCGLLSLIRAFSYAKKEEADNKKRYDDLIEEIKGLRGDIGKWKTKSK
jgi:hypothetical protein